MKKFRGSEFFRQRILVSLLSQRPIIIEDIRSDVSEGSVGLHDHELSLLRLIDNITNGTRTIINRTGTSLRFHPGILKGGTDIKHECTGIRPIGYYLECLLAVCPFTKERLQITLIGSVCMSSNGNAMDPSVDRLCRTVVPVLNRFMDGNEIHVRVIARHAGMDGRVEIRSDPVSLSLKPINLCKCGRVKRIRGLSVGSGGVSTSILNEMIHTVKLTFLNFIPDVYITMERKRTKTQTVRMFGVFLVAETNSGEFYCGEAYHLEGDSRRLVTGSEVAAEATRELILGIYRGGCVDSCAQWLVALYAALNKPDVSRVNVGRGGLTQATVNVLRLIKDTFNELEFAFDDEPSNMVDDQNDLVICCVGANYANMAKGMV